MKYEVHCDESRAELLTGEAPGRGPFFLLGSIWLARDEKAGLKEDIRSLRAKYSTWSEFKWTKLSMGKLPFYTDLVRRFFEWGPAVSFRCLKVRGTTVDLKHYHGSDAELGFYKFYYQMLVHWFVPRHEYAIYVDAKTARKANRLKVLERVLQNASQKCVISRVQAIRSVDSDFIQLADLLTGAVAARSYPHALAEAKERLSGLVEELAGFSIAETTPLWEEKFNIFNLFERRDSG